MNFTKFALLSFAVLLVISGESSFAYSSCVDSGLLSRKSEAASRSPNANWTQEEIDSVRKGVQDDIDAAEEYCKGAPARDAEKAEKRRIAHQKYLDEQARIDRLPEPKLGMSQKTVADKTKWGLPLSINTTTNASGKHEQWVYWSMSTILTARRQLSWPVEAGKEFDCLRC